MKKLYTSKLIGILSVFFILLLSHQGFSRQLTWTGGDDSLFTNFRNWNPEYSPSSTDTVTIVTSTHSHYPYLTANTSVSKLTITSGHLFLQQYTLIVSDNGLFSGGEISSSSSGLLQLRASSCTFSGTLINTKVDAVCDRIFLNGSVFNKKVSFEKTANIEIDGTGNNYFNDSATFIQSGPGSFFISYQYANTFNSYVSFKSSADGTFFVAYKGHSTFNGNVEITATNGSIYFGSESGDTSYFAAGHTLSIGAAGFADASLVFNKFISQTKLNSSLNLSGSSTFNAKNSEFYGPMNITAAVPVFYSSKFDDSLSVIKTGNISASSSGANTFVGPLSIRNHSRSPYYFANSYADSVNNDCSLSTDSSGYLYIFNIGHNSLMGNLSISGNHVVVGNESSWIDFTGMRNQIITCNADLHFMKLSVNNSGGNIILNKSVTIYDSLFLYQGILVVPNTFLITLPSGAKVTGASSYSFIDGKVKKIGNTSFFFPIGNNGIYRPLEMTAPSNSSDAYSAQMIYESQNLGVTLDSNFTDLNTCFYWDFERTNGTSNVHIKLYWDSLGCGIADTTGLKIYNWNNSYWSSIGNGGISGDVNFGSISDSTYNFTYGKFVLATSIPNPYIINPKLSGVSRDLPENIFGYNGSSVKLGQTWNDLSVSTSSIPPALDRKNISTIRVPAGIDGNYWDWRTGWYKKEKELPDNWFYLTPSQQKLNPGGDQMADFKKNIGFVAGTPIFNFNVLTSDYFYQLASLYYSKELNLPVKYIEFGNEFYLNNEQYQDVFPTAGDYISLANTWAEAISDVNHSPFASATDIKIGVVGASSTSSDPGRRRTWLQNIISGIDLTDSKIDAITLHEYYGTGLAGLSFSTSTVGKMFDAAFANEQAVLDNEIQQISGIGNPAFSTPFEVWITEFNMSDNSHHTVGTWAHALFCTTQALKLLESPNVTKLVSHAMTDNGLFGNFFESTDGYSSLSDGQKPINASLPVTDPSYPNTHKWDYSALGSALNQFALAVKNKDHATLLDFSNDAAYIGTIDNNQSSYSNLYGCFFESSIDNTQDLLIVNYKGVTLNLILKNILSAGYSYTYEKIKPVNILDGVDANPIDIYNLTTNTPIYGKNLILYKGVHNILNSISMPPYSILRIHGVPSNSPALTVELAANEICQGTSTSLVIHGGTPPYSINSSAISTGTFTTSLGSMEISGLSAGTYTYTVSDAASPKNSASVTIIVDDPITNLVVTTTGPLNCTGSSNLTASFHQSSNGSQYPYSYLWTPTEGVILGNSCANDKTPMNACITVNPTKTTDYQVYVTDGVSWAHSNPITVNKGPISIDAGRDFTVCTGTPFNIHPITDLVPGVTSMIYNWAWSGGGSLTGQLVPILSSQSLSTPGQVTYTLTATDGTCSVSDNITVTAVNCCGATTFQTNLHYVDGFDLINSLSSTSFNVVYSKSNQNLSYDDIVTVTSLSSSTFIFSDADLWIQPYTDLPTNPTKKLTKYIFQKCKFQMSQDAIIRVRSNITAIFKGCSFDVCNLGAFSHPMWQGFIVDRDSDKVEPSLEISSYNHGVVASSISNAKTAIYLHRDSPYKIEDCTFSDNYKDIVIENYKAAVSQNYNSNGATAFYIRHCTFTASGFSLLPPHVSDTKKTAIELNDDVDVIVGDYLNSNITNIFEKSLYGIKANQSGFECYNSTFQNIDMLSGSQYQGSCITSYSPFTEDDLTIQVGDEAATQGNKFNNSSNGIYLTGLSNNRIYNNIFGKENQTAGANRILFNGVYTDGSEDKLVDISRNNHFYDFNFAVTCRNISEGATLRIDSNYFVNGWFDTGTNYNATAINVLSGGYNPLASGLILNNVIGEATNAHQARIGINVSAISNVAIKDNTIYFHENSTPAYDYRGARIEDGTQITFRGNSIINSGSPTSSFTSNFIGCYIKKCNAPTVQCNTITNMGYAMQYDGDNINVPLARNTFTGYTKGIFINNASIGYSQGEPPYASFSGRGYENQWDITSSNLRVDGQTITSQAIDWYFQDITGQSKHYSPVFNNLATGVVNPFYNQSNGLPENFCGGLNIDCQCSPLRIFSSIIERDSIFELLTNEQKYDEYKSFYQFVQTDTSLLSNSETDSRFRSVYDSLSTTNFSSFDSSFQYLGRRQSSLLSASLLSIRASNNRESLTKAYIQVKKDEIDSGDVIHSDSLWLNYTASLSALDSGEVVFWSRNDLFEEVDDASNINSSRIAKHNIPKIVTADATLIPNPGIAQFEVKTIGSIVKSILMEDATGKKVKYLEKANIVDVNSLREGIYFVYIYFENEEHKVLKFIKIN